MQTDEVLPGSQPIKKVKIDENSHSTGVLSELDQLKKHSIVVADTGDFSLIDQYLPDDSTTNPTLILQAAKNPLFSKIIDDSIEFGLKNFDNYVVDPSKSKKKSKQTTVTPVVYKELQQWKQTELIELIYDHLFVSFGKKLLEKIKGYVSTEVDAKLSFNKNQTIKRAKRIINLYQQAGVDTDRVLIKIASTWQGIKAGEALLKNKIKCNMTLVFHKIQGIACAKSKLFLISPFVGRILDWFKKDTGKTEYASYEDPGVVSVTEIYNYFKKFNIKTIVMGASFRNTGEIKQLCGCDRLTISPKLLDELKAAHSNVQVKLSQSNAQKLNIQQIEVDQTIFRYEMNKSQMANDLLSAGIRSFEKDGDTLKEMIKKRILELYS